MKPGCGWAVMMPRLFKIALIFWCGGRGDAPHTHRTRPPKVGGAKRGAGVAVVDMDGLDISSPVADDDHLLAVNDALEKLSAIDSRKAELVKLRYFVGLNFEEAAAALGIAVPTAKQ